MLKALLAFGFIFSTAVWADFKVPPLTGPVVDAAQVLQPETRQGLEDFLSKVYSSGGSQIQIAILPDLGGLSIEEVGIRLADEWKIGRAKQDTGVILLMGMAEHRVRIEVGKGREGDLPDLKASRIIREVIVPRMRAGSVDRAVVDGIFAIVHYTDPNFATGHGISIHEPEKWSGNTVQFILLLLLMVFFVLPSFFGRSLGRRRGFYGGYYSGGDWGGGGGSWGGGGGGFSGGGSSGSW